MQASEQCIFSSMHDALHSATTPAIHRTIKRFSKMLVFRCAVMLVYGGFSLCSNGVAPFRLNKDMRMKRT